MKSRLLLLTGSWRLPSLALSMPPRLRSTSLTSPQMKVAIRPLPSLTLLHPSLPESQKSRGTEHWC